MRFSDPDWHNPAQNDKKYMSSPRELVIYGILISVIIAFITFRFVVPMINKGLFTIN